MFSSVQACRETSAMCDVAVFFRSEDFSLQRTSVVDWAAEMPLLIVSVSPNAPHTQSMKIALGSDCGFVRLTMQCAILE